MQKMKFLVMATVAVALLVSCTNSAKDKNLGHDADKNGSEHGSKPHWSYEGESGPENWASICPAYSPCSGQHQSPIDLPVNLSVENKVNFTRSYQCSDQLQFVNNGHSVQINFNTAKASTITVNNEIYELKQFHFHCPSEHTLNGEAFPAEIHLVHVAASGNISVIGIFFKEGEENNFLASVLANLPAHTGDTTVVTTEICPSDMYDEDQDFYIYEGSLTTPPCTEGVNWFVSREIAEASPEQIAELAAVMPKHNARPVQPINDRAFGSLDE